MAFIDNTPLGRVSEAIETPGSPPYSTSYAKWKGGQTTVVKVTKPLAPKPPPAQERERKKRPPQTLHEGKGREGKGRWRQRARQRETERDETFDSSHVAQAQEPSGKVCHMFTFPAKPEKMVASLVAGNGSGVCKAGFAVTPFDCRRTVCPIVCGTGGMRINRSDGKIINVAGTNESPAILKINRTVIGTSGVAGMPAMTGIGGHLGPPELMMKRWS